MNSLIDFWMEILQLPAPASNGPSLSITLYYLPALRFVSVHTQLTDFEAEGIAARYALHETFSQFSLPVLLHLICNFV